jgi:molecular chaperone DnaJ
MLEVKIPAGTQPDAKLVLRGKGVKDVNSIHRGDQYIHLKIKIPKNLTQKQKDLLLEFEKEGRSPPSLFSSANLTPWSLSP